MRSVIVHSWRHATNDGWQKSNGLRHKTSGPWWGCGKSSEKRSRCPSGRHGWYPSGNIESQAAYYEKRFASRGAFRNFGAAIHCGEVSTSPKPSAPNHVCLAAHTSTVWSTQSADSLFRTSLLVEEIQLHFDPISLAGDKHLCERQHCLGWPVWIRPLRGTANDPTNFIGIDGNKNVYIKHMQTTVSPKKL